MNELAMKIRRPRFGRMMAAMVVILLLLGVMLTLIVLPRLRPQRPPQPAAPAPVTTAATTPTAPEHATQDDVQANNRAVGLMGRYDYREAYTIFEEISQRHPQWHDVKVNLAIAAINRQQDGDEEHALGLLRDVLHQDAQQLRARYTLGLLLLYQGQREEAAEHLARVAQHDPADAHAAYFLGQIHAAAEEHEEAIRWYDRAIALDPYLRSAYYGKSRSLMSLGRGEEGETQFETFERLEKNPRAHTAEFLYTRMGPKAMAQAIDRAIPSPHQPDGAVFLEAEPLLLNGDQVKWRAFENPQRALSITAADISGNGLPDLFIPGALDEPGGVNAVCMNIGERGYVLDREHPLAKVADVNAALWGDLDNDGLVDVYLLRNGPNMLMLQSRPGEWRDLTAMTGTAGGGHDTVHGLLVDADHDGDLDIFLVNRDGSNELLNNNRNGTFDAIAQSQGIAGEGVASRQVIALDLERDRDLDIIVLNEHPPHEVYLNDRLWQYRKQGGGSAYQQLLAAEIVAAVSGDLDADGRPEVYSIDSRGEVRQWRTNERGMFVPVVVPIHMKEDGSDDEGEEEPLLAPPQIAIADVNGDGHQELLISKASGWIAVSPGTGEVVARADDAAPLAGWGLVVLDVARGPAVVGMRADGAQPVIRRAGAGRHEFAGLRFTGMDDPGHALRSNASGIGTHYAARFGSNWLAGAALPMQSAAGQSAQPITIGLAGHAQIDFVSIDWSDGVYQTEIDLAAGKLHTITETQRQLASCPVVFVWDGEKYEFASDVLGVGGIGFAIAPGEYAQPRPWENYLLPEGLLEPKGDRYVIKIGEPMEEALYLDSAALVAYNLPPGWSMTVDERMGINDPQPTGEPVFYRRFVLPVRAFNERGEDVTAMVRGQDDVAAPVGELDERFLGRLAGEHVLTLDFEEPLDARIAQGLPSLGTPATPYLVADGWIEYPYSQTIFSAWQAGAEYRAPTLEARDSQTGEWHIVLEQFGYPAGFARQMAVPIPIDRLPSGATAIRLRTSQEIYWDRLMVVLAEERPAEASRHVLELVQADLRQAGFPQRKLFEQRRAYYDYSDRPPLWDARHQRGSYTRFGDVSMLIRRRDNALAILGPGEEIHMEFAAIDPSCGVADRSRLKEGGSSMDSVPELQSGWSRRFVLEFTGWCKDMDLYTRDGETLDPLPSHADEQESESELHQILNTRYRSGR